MPETFTADDFATGPATFTEADFEPAAFAASDFPDAPEELTGRIDGNPFYLPSLGEFDEYRHEKWRTPAQPLKAAKEAVSAMVASGKSMWQAGKETEARIREEQGRRNFGQRLAAAPRIWGDALQTLGEAASRGTAKTGRLARGLLDKIASVLEDLPDSGMARLAQPSIIPNRPPPTASEQGEIDQRDYDRKLRADYDRFMVNRQVDQFMELTRRGNETVLPEVLGETDRAMAEPLSDFVDLTDVATFGAGKVVEGALRAGTRKAASAGAKGAGVVLEKTGEAASAVGRAPERAAAAVTRVVTGSEEAAETVRKTVSGGGASLAVAPYVGLTIPGVSTVAQAATGAKVAGAALDAAGDAAQAAGRGIDLGPSRIGLLERISKDGTAPLWMRKASANVVVLDPAFKAAAGAAGAAGRGAVGGAGMGAAIGFGLSGGDVEAAAGGAGGGLIPGAIGGLYNRVQTREARGIAEADADLTRWLAGKSEEEVGNIARLRLSRDQALKVADVERWTRGVVNEEGGDVAFRYLDDAGFRKQFGSSQKGAEIVQGDKPVVFINTDFRGPRSLFHEVFHSIDDLDAFDPQRIELNRRLFTETTPDGAVLNKGLFDAADVAAFEQSYRARLGPGARAEWDVMPAEERARRIRKEVRAESFASMVSGATGKEILTGASGWRRRLADSMLLADHASSLGRMRRFLETVGVEFKASGDPSELFFKNGRPTSNTPEVDAALRDYMRAKRRVTDRLVAGDDDTPAVVFDEPAIRANPKLARALAEQHPDWDGWQKEPGGKVKFIGGNPVLATAREMKRIESKRGQAMVAALKAVPDIGGPDFVKENPNGSWGGTRFSEAQLRALEALADDVLSPSIKDRLRQMNDLAGGAGRQIVIDYNAALDKGKYSSSIIPATRIAVPLQFKITKAGNFLMDTLDVTHFMRKLGDWQTSKPRAFDAWGGDVNAFMRDVFKYLDNHQRALPGATDMDPDAATAIVKRNVVKDLFNVGGPDTLTATGGRPISGEGGKDNLIRGRRIDRINRITPGEGSPFPIDYYKQKANFAPAQERPAAPTRSALNAPAAIGSPRTPVQFAEVVRVTRDQAVADFARELGIPYNTARVLALPALDRLHRDQPARLGERARAGAAATALRTIAQRDREALLQSLLTGGLNAAREHLTRRTGVRPK